MAVLSLVYHKVLASSTYICPAKDTASEISKTKKNFIGLDN